MSEVTERAVRFVDVPEEVAGLSLASTGLSERAVVAILEVFEQARAGRFSTVALDSRYLTSRNPTALRQFVHDNVHLFRHEYYSYFDQKESDFMFRQFNHIAGDNADHFTFEQFSAGVGDILKHTGMPAALFRIFDQNQDGIVDFREYICAMSVLLRGCVLCTPGTRALLIFAVCRVHV